MVEAATSGSSERHGASTSAGRSTHRRIRRLRGLPGGRAVAGALLVTVAAVGVFAAHLQATAEPTSRYLVAGGTIDPGTRFSSVDELRRALTSTPLDLVPDVAARAIEVDRLDTLVGHVVIAPLEFGDLLTRTSFAAESSVAATQAMSFPVERPDAVGGTLRAGERIDVAATYGTGGETYTSYVVRGVPLLGVSGQDGDSIGSSRELSLTVAVSSMDDVLALGHAVNTASVFVSRSASPAMDDVATPGSYRPVPVVEGPAPDPAAAVPDNSARGFEREQAVGPTDEGRQQSVLEMSDE